jgi:hypothetical protein
MSQFAYYATSCAFHLNLSKQMAQCLWLIDRDQRSRGTGEVDWAGAFSMKEHFGAYADNFVAAARALSRRGLVDWHEPKKTKEGRNDYSKPSHTLTQAGIHVLELCILADIIPARWSKVVELKSQPKRRRAA